MVYTYERRTKIVEWYIETKSYVKTQRRFAAHFETRAKPSRRMIQYQVEKFREHGTVHDLNNTRSGKELAGRQAMSTQSETLWFKVPKSQFADVLRSLH